VALVLGKVSLAGAKLILAFFNDDRKLNLGFGGPPLARSSASCITIARSVKFSHSTPTIGY
jgi:hypothetical protein